MLKISRIATPFNINSIRKSKEFHLIIEFVVLSYVEIMSGTYFCSSVLTEALERDSGSSWL